MSDQTPPSDQPTPPPAEGAGSGADLGEQTPPPPPPPDETAVATEPPPAPAPKSRTGLIIGIVAGLLVLAVIAVLAVVLVANKGPEKHSITVTSTAGGMKRDKAKETEVKTALDATETQFKSAFKVVSLKTAIYDQNSASRGPKGQVIFVGFKFKKPSAKHPADFVKALRKVATANKLTVTDVKTSSSDDKAVCLSTAKDAAQKTSTCFWITRDSGGALLPNIPGYDAKQMGKLLTGVRSDVEKTL
jgi:hypothetical protein